MKRVILLVLFLVLVAAPVGSQVPDDKLIVPGQRIGKWTLEMTVDDLVKMNGPATMQSWKEFSSGVNWADRFSVFHWQQPYSLWALSRDEKTVVALTVAAGLPLGAGFEARSLSTERGIRPSASSNEQVTAAYGSPTGISSTGETISYGILVYDEIGVAFSSIGSVVFAVWVFRPRTAKTIWVTERVGGPQALVAASKGNLKNIATALESYYIDHGRYPAALSDLVPEYLRSLPNDPCTDKPYVYVPANSPPDDYRLTTGPYPTNSECASVVPGLSYTYRGGLQEVP